MLPVYSHRYDTPKWQAYVTPEDKAFVFKNGFAVRSLYDLKQALVLLPEDVIAHHIDQGNHIADWVRNIVGDHELADVLADSKHRWGMVVALERHMMRTLNLPHYVAQRWLSSSRYGFSFASGEQVSSLEELAEKLNQVSDEVVSFHCERTPNDVAKWVNDVVGDYELAEMLEEASSREQMQRYVADHVAMLVEAAKE